MGADPEDAVRQAVRAARAEDALTFQAYVETAEIPPADGVVLTGSLADVVRIADARRVQDAARVDVSVRPAALDTSFALGLRLRRVDTRWKVVQVENARGFVRSVERAREERLARENAHVESRIRKVVQLGEVQRTVGFRDVPRYNQLDRYADLSLRVPVFNAGQEVVAELLVEVLVTDSAGTDYRYLLRSSHPIPHVATGTVILDAVLGIMTGYPTDHLHGYEAEAVRTWRLVSARPVSAVFTHGAHTDSVRPYASWAEYLARSHRSQ